jgi:uncharacterized coiled-coil protein SlyX
MKHIKKLYIFIFFFIIILTSCNNKPEDIKFDNSIDIYTHGTIENKNIEFKFNRKLELVYINNVLELDYEIRITNNKNKDITILINEPQAFGNDTFLEEEILEEFEYNDKSKTVKFEEKNLTIPKKKYVDLPIKLVIQDGNSECKYRMSFRMNNVFLNIYSCDKNFKLDNFLYVHNPSCQDYVLIDATYDPNAYFGYKPNETGSLKQFAAYDWTNKDDVINYKNERIKYIKENDQRIKELENELRSQNKTIEEIARACSKLRNDIRLEQYKNDPEGLEQIKQRNLEKYGHEDGPQSDELYAKYNNSWEMVLEKCYSTNRGMDACCGVYDMYFYLYNKEFAY